MLILTILTSIFRLIALYIGLFSLWSIFEREHVEDTKTYIDRFLIAGLLGTYLSRLPALIAAHATTPITASALLNPLIGEYSLPVAIVCTGIILYALLRDHWPDRILLLDFTSMAVSVGLSVLFLGQTVIILITALVTRSLPSLQASLIASAGILYFLGLSRLLSYFERSYRTFFWYRYRRSSAQTGFVTAVFAIALGLFGILSGVFAYPFALVSLQMFSILWSLLVMVSGFVLLYVRSGRMRK